MTKSEINLPKLCVLRVMMVLLKGKNIATSTLTEDVVSKSVMSDVSKLDEKTDGGWDDGKITKLFSIGNEDFKADEIGR